LRKANRTRAAWAILAPLALINVLLCVAERQLNAYFVFHYHQYICSAIGDLLSAFALSLAVWLTVADALELRNRLLRSVLLFLFLLLAGVWQLAPNAWPMLSPGVWLLAYGIILLAFLLGHGMLKALLGKFFGPKGFRNWHAAFCLVFGLCPMLVLGVLGLKLDRPMQRQSTLELIRVWLVLAAAFSLPYFVFFWFVLLARLNPFYARRLAQGFGLTHGSPNYSGLRGRREGLSE
jgi:hypothetical protein